jgi:hypothetical protein
LVGEYRVSTIKKPPRIRRILEIDSTFKDRIFADSKITPNRCHADVEELTSQSNDRLHLSPLKFVVTKDPLRAAEVDAITKLVYHTIKMVVSEVAVPSRQSCCGVE